LDVLSFTNRFTFAFSTLEIIDFFTGFVASFSSSSYFARVAWQRVVALLLEESYEEQHEDDDTEEHDRRAAAHPEKA